MEPIQILLALGGLALGGAGAYFFAPSGEKITKEKITRETQKILDESKAEARKIKEESKTEIEEAKQYAQEENERLEAHVERLKESLKLKEKHTQSRQDKNKQVESLLKSEAKEIKEMKEAMANEGTEVVNLLVKKTGISREKAIEQASEEVTSFILLRKAQFTKKRIEEVEEDSAKISRSILVNALQRYSDKSSVDRSNSFVTVKSERFKAFLVGKKGENIDHLESKMDVEIIFNDYPKTITVGGFNLVKRQIVKSAIEILQKSGSDVTGAKIDDALKKAEDKVNKIMRENALAAVKIIGLQDVPEGVLKHIGRLHFRTSYGQNALRHCIEVGMFAGLLAAEVGANIEVARIAGFFHDIGKALSEESDKGHDFITKDILEEFKYPEEIIHAAWVHHEAEPAKTLEAKIVMAADALSASRPGARLESLERYLQRIKELEETAGSFAGIEKTFAISAGREVRVLVRPNEITDKDMIDLAHNIAHKIETNLNYPGNIKVNVIRRNKWKAVAATKK